MENNYTLIPLQAMVHGISIAVIVLVWQVMRPTQHPNPARPAPWAGSNTLPGTAPAKYAPHIARPCIPEVWSVPVLTGITGPPGTPELQLVPGPRVHPEI